MTAQTVSDALSPHGLFVMGIDGKRMIVGTDHGWWDHFITTPEYQEGDLDPIDRWSKRILNGVARDHGAQAVFPSDGPPYAPFIAWARATGRFWQSPTGMMVHDTAGLMISIRGALEFNTPFAADAASNNPCLSCDDKPCVSACPVHALSETHPYDVPACKNYLRSDAGTECMSRGCEVRRACPVSQRFNRAEAQSALHMQAFLG